MASIVTLTFSPCIDKSTSVESLIPEKKLACSLPVLEPGGGGINVARVIKRLGAEAIAVFPSGGYTGQFFNHLLQQEDIPCGIVNCKNETRENIIVLDQSSNHQYRFGMPGTALSESEWRSCLRKVEAISDGGFIVASGSLPPGVPLMVYDELTRIAGRKKAKLVIDTSGEALTHAASQGVYLMKPNLGELSTVAGVARIDETRIEEIAREVIFQYKCEVLVVSLGVAGAVLITKNECYRATPPAIKRKSTVGAGDSMVAGIVFCLSKGTDLQQALRYGVACGTAATLNPGTALCYKKDADRLYPLIVGTNNAGSPSLPID
jgi:6-phosphofructokinase 2